MTQEERDEILQAIGHLGAAITQTLPSDDQIIAEHVRDAHKILKQVLYHVEDKRR
jgi:hypothetical protein